MKFSDPSRPRLSSTNRPCWLGTQIPLPPVEIWPFGGQFIVRVMLAGSSLAIRAMSQPDIREFLDDWTLYPERALMIWFGKDAPKSHSMNTLTPSAPSKPLSAEDLGL